MLVELWLECDHKETEAAHAAGASTQYGSMPVRENSCANQMSVTEKIKKAAGGVMVGIIVFGCFLFMIVQMHFLTEQSHAAVVFRVYKITVCVIMIGISFTGHVILHGNKI